MKIAVLLEDYTQLGGVEKVTSNLVDAFLEVELPLWGIISKNAKNSSSKISFSNSINIEVLNNNSIEDIIKKNSITHIIVQIQSLNEAVYDIKLFKKVGVKVIAILHNSPYLYVKWLMPKNRWKDYIQFLKVELMSRIKNRIYFKIILKRSISFLMVSEKAKDEMVEILGKDYENLDYIYNFVPVVNNSLNLEKKNIIIYGGRLSKDKRVFETVKILSPLLKKYSNWQYHIYGEGEEEEMIREYLLVNKINNIKLMGVVKNMDEYLSQSKICLLYSLFEGLPTIFIEAAKNQNVLVSSNSKGGVSDIIRNNGYIIDNNAELYSKIEYLIENEDVLEKMKLENNNILEKFNYKNILSKWYNILKAD